MPIRPFIYKMCIVTMLVCSTSLLPAQLNPVYNEVDMLVLRASYGVVTPVGRLSDRFGTGFAYGGELEWMSWPGNWIGGIQAHISFGAPVRENVLAFLEDENGEIVGRDLALSRAFLQQRIMMGIIYGGKLIPVIPSNNRSGIRLTAGIGYMRHWIKVNDEMASLPQIEGDYGAGYDRLTAGWVTSQFVGYHHISLSRRIQLIGGVEAFQGFTRSQRDYDFQDRGGDTSLRFDLLIGLRAGISIALYSGEQTGDIYY